MEIYFRVGVPDPPSGTISFAGAGAMWPTNDQPLYPGRTPRFTAVANYTLQNTAQGEVFIQVLDKPTNGSVLNIGDATIPVPSGSGTVGLGAPFLTVGPFDLASSFSGKSIYYQLGLNDKSTGKTLALSTPVEFKVGTQPMVSLELGCGGNDGQYSSLDPVDMVFLAESIDSLQCPAGSYPQTKILTNFQGSRGSIDRLILTDSGSLIGRDPSGQEVAGGQRETVLGLVASIPASAGNFVNLQARLTLENGQAILSQPLRVPLQRVQIVSASPSDKSRLPDDKSTTYIVQLEYNVVRPNAVIRRGAFRDNVNVAGNTSPVAVGPGSKKDTFLERAESVEYSLENKDGTASTYSRVLHYNFERLAPLPQVTDPSKSVVASLTKGLINITKNVTNRVTGEVLQAGVNSFLDGSSTNSYLHYEKGHSASATLTDFIPINSTWSFDPPIPRDGSFAGSITLNYSATDLPDDPNVTEGNLKVISFDPATGIVEPYDTTIDTANKTATAPINNLAPYYTLAVLGPFASTTLAVPVIRDITAPGTALYVVNSGATDAALNTSVYDPAGTAVSASSSTLKAGQQLSFSGSAVLSNTARGAWVRQSVATGSVFASVKLANGPRLEALTVSSYSATSLLLSNMEVSDTFSTSVYVANPNTFTVSATLSLYDSMGGLAGTSTAQVPAKGVISSDVTALFPQIAAPFTGYLKVTANGRLSAAELIASPLAMAALGPQLLIGAIDQPVRLYAAYLASGGGSYTTLNLVNPTQRDARITLSAFSDTGAALGSPVTTTLLAGQQYRHEIGQIFGISSSALSTGYFIVDTSIAGVVGDITFGDAIANRSRAALALNPFAQVSSVIPLIVNDSSATATVSIANPNGKTANVTLRLYNSSGSLLGTSTQQAPISGRKTIAVTQVFPAAAGLASGYMTLTSDQSVIAFALLAPSSGDFAAVAAQGVAGPEASGGITMVPNLTVSPASLDFGAVPAGTTKTAGITLTNTGNADLTIASLAGVAAPFSLPPGLTPFVLTPGANRSITVSFRPASAGPQSSRLTIGSTDPDRPTLAVAFTGSGGTATSTAPQIAAGGIVNAASYGTVLSRGALAVLFGSNLARAEVHAQILPLGPSLGGVSVTIDGIPAPMLYVFPGQLAFQVPFEVPVEGTVSVIVTRDGIASAPSSAALAENSIGIFMYQRTASAIDPVLTHADGSLVSPSQPAHAGETLIVYATGIGVLNPPASGAAAGVNPLSVSHLTPFVTANGQAAAVPFAGLTPFAVGLSQLNVTLPSNLLASADGTVRFLIRIGNAYSQTVSLAFQ